MKRTTLRNSLIAALLVGTAAVGTLALAQGYGPGWGMMGGYGHQGMGPWMMGGYGPHSMSPGMMWGHGAGDGTGALPNLTDEQRTKIGKIENDARTRQWELMGKMHEEQSRLVASNTGKPDDAAISERYKKIADLRQQMFDSSLAAQKQVDAVLTKEQRDQLASADHGWWCGY